ncbi:hypothetical protein L195_g056879, partial [Trifolium pratense]
MLDLCFILFYRYHFDILHTADDLVNETKLDKELVEVSALAKELYGQNDELMLLPWIQGGHTLGCEIRLLPRELSPSVANANELVQ